MNCIKCGKDTKSEQIFCQRCLNVMEDYPVKADVHVQLPSRPAITTQKKSSRKRILLSADEQVEILRKRARRLTWLIVALLMLLTMAVAFVFHLMDKNEGLRLIENYINSSMLL